MLKKDRDRLEKIEHMISRRASWASIAKACNKTLTGIHFHYASLRKQYLTELYENGKETNQHRRG